MPIALTLLDGVRWDGTPVTGDRMQALLAALADAGRTVGTDRLVALVWGEDLPANPAKALQVLVSRLLGPRTPKISPGRTSRSMLSTARKAPNRFTSPVAFTALVAVMGVLLV